MSDPRFLCAQGLAREAGKLMRRRFEDRSSFSLTFKGHQDFLTEVDGEVESFVKKRLAETFPSDTFIGEEGSREASDSVWIVDPIDGTSNFARGIPHFCISIAYLKDHKPNIGVIYDPMSDEMYAAVSGGGATLNGVPMKVSGMTDIRSATLEIGWNHRSGVPGYLSLLGRVMGLGAGTIRGGSGALGMAYVAAGRIDAYVEQHINSWDVLAGLLMVQEAGGHVSDFLAGEGLAKGNPILACTPALRRVLAETSGIGTPE
ncbi:myo-inositol-1(or 4)-monophosphatase [Rhizobiales bacterium GAS191]|jgi:myo-inositol-1(or 4)-monophosphatase|nr:myo-inositol-1(or 4)-monophosphatase [Rhizobiales bacterium GAS113]SEB95354.1 myo-inositol-1(or 4)-monophosphatase [Rhizobiales bacterium GAS191]